MTIASAPSVRTAFPTQLYTGPNARCLDPKQAAVLRENSAISRSVYRPGTVDYVFFDHAVVLHEETAEYLYTRFTPTEQPYTRGTRIFLEKIVDGVTAGLTSERDKAIALLDWVCELPRTYTRAAWLGATGGGELFHGGTEEEVIRKGSNMCNEMSRVLGILAQIAGLPSRYVGHMTMIDYDNPKASTGHGVNEIFVDGQWAYFDIRGRFFVKQDDSLASAWDLLQDPELIHRQPEYVLKHRSPHSDHSLADRYYTPPAVTIVANYLVADHAKYDYSWVYPSESLAREARDAGRRLRVTEHHDLLPQPRLRIG